jgi:hypothetical protein
MQDGEQVGIGYYSNGKHDVHMFSAKGAAAAAKEEAGPDVTKLWDQGIKVFTKEDGTVDSEGLAAHVQRGIQLWNAQHEEHVLNKYGLGQKSRQILAGIERAKADGNTEAATDLEDYRKMMIANPDDRHMPASAMSARKRIERQWGPTYLRAPGQPIPGQITVPMGAALGGAGATGGVTTPVDKRPGAEAVLQPGRTKEDLPEGPPGNKGQMGEGIIGDTKYEVKFVNHKPVQTSRPLTTQERIQRNTMGNLRDTWNWFQGLGGKAHEAAMQISDIGVPAGGRD